MVRHYSKHRIRCFFCFISLYIFIQTTLAEEACKFMYTGYPEFLNNRTLVLPDEVVAMSEYVPVYDAAHLVHEGEPASIFFIIDNSVSMLQTDPGGSRFTVVHDLIDSIYQRSPNSEVGISVFSGVMKFKEEDDAIFESVHNYLGCYIPLLKLNKDYNGRTGYEILKFYMETNNGQMIYQGDVFSGTHINAGFEAAKKAMSVALYPKDYQFVIFFSDGEANVNNLLVPTNYYVQGENVPTTFTVYFGESAFQNLQTMTNNIKSNGYSSSNHLSNLWSIETDYETLMKLLMENVIHIVIQQEIKYTPEELTVNSINPITGWDSAGFLFGEMFELFPTNDFEYVIVYDVLIDTLIRAGIPRYDTTHVIKYTVEIQESAPLPDSVELTCWGRRLEFYHDNTLITGANEKMEELEIRFTPYEVDTFYVYEDVEVTITHAFGTPKDVEKFTLAEVGNYFSHTFPRTVATANPGDNTLQHQDPDSIIATFKNPNLFLDTLRIAIPYSISAMVVLEQGIYFDNNADGHVDSLYIKFADVAEEEIQNNLDEIMNEIELPAFRDFSNLKYEYADMGIAVSLKENAPEIHTYITDEDKLVVPNPLYLASGALLAKKSVDIIDSMAPVIMQASLIDSLSVSSHDELTVVFSESVGTVTDKRPFRFYCTGADKTYNADLSVISQNDETGVFEVESVDGIDKIVDGDSIRINWELSGDNIYDAAGNNQDNPRNIRREIAVTVIKDMIRVTKGIYYDNNADGRVDSVYFTVSGDKFPENADAVADELGKHLPAWRKFTIDNSYIHTDGVSYSVTEGLGDAGMTYITTDDIFIIQKEIELPDGGVLDKVTLTMEDAMAPVIMKASVVDSLDPEGTDILTVIFSETVAGITEERPFLYYRPGENRDFDACLNTLSQNENAGDFKITRIEGVEAFENGDSIRIYYKSEISDKLDNEQTNPENIRREIAVTKISMNYDVVLKSTVLDYNEVTDPGDLVNNECIKDLLAGTDEHYTGLMIITVEPDDSTKVTDLDSLAATLSIYDAVGNVLLEGADMCFDNTRRRLVYLWDGRNPQQRKTGGSAYAAIVPVRFFCGNKEEKQRNRTIYGTVGVRD